MKTIILFVVLGCSLFLVNALLLPETPAGSAAREPSYVPSVYRMDGNYIINYSVLYNNRNKKVLLDEIQKSELEVKSSVKDIPGFIKEFLDATNREGTFEIAEADQQWAEGSVTLGEIKKFYDPAKKDTVTIITMNGVLPQRQFKYFAIGQGIALLSYYTGGHDRGLEITLIKFKDKMVVDYWSVNSKKLDLNSKEDLLEYIRNENVTAGGC
jgi:hypothetical protein